MEKGTQMTKKELVKVVAGIDGIAKKEAADLVDGLFEVIMEALESGEELKISGFGKWQVASKKAQLGRNPQTGEKIMIDKRKVVTFKVSEQLRGKVNGNGDH